MVGDADAAIECEANNYDVEKGNPPNVGAGGTGMSGTTSRVHERLRTPNEQNVETGDPLVRREFVGINDRVRRWRGGGQRGLMVMCYVVRELASGLDDVTWPELCRLGRSWI